MVDLAKGSQAMLKAGIRHCSWPRDVMRIKRLVLRRWQDLAPVPLETFLAGFEEDMWVMSFEAWIRKTASLSRTFSPIHYWIAQIARTRVLVREGISYSKHRSSHLSCWFPVMGMEGVALLLLCGKREADLLADDHNLPSSSADCLPLLPFVYLVGVVVPRDVEYPSKLRLRTGLPHLPLMRVSIGVKCNLK